MSFQRGALLFNIRRYEAAEKEYRAALADKPGDAGAHTMIAWCLLNQKKPAEAMCEAKEAVAADPNQDGGYAVLAGIFLAGHRLDEALDAIQQAISIAPLKSHHHATLASIHLMKRQWTKAIAAAEAGLAIDPHNITCANARGLALTNLGRYEEAKLNNQVSLRIDPMNANSQANQGWALLHAGNYDSAADFFEESLRIDPNSLWAQVGRKISRKKHGIIGRIIHRYLRFVQRRAGVVQWSLIIGIILLGYTGVAILHRAADSHPELAPLVVLALIIFILPVQLTWAASPMFVWIFHWKILGRFSVRARSIGINIAAAVILLGLTFLVGILIGAR